MGIVALFCNLALIVHPTISSKSMTISSLVGGRRPLSWRVLSQPNTNTNHHRPRVLTGTWGFRKDWEKPTFLQVNWEVSATRQLIACLDRWLDSHTIVGTVGCYEIMCNTCSSVPHYSRLVNCSKTICHFCAFSQILHLIATSDTARACTLLWLLTFHLHKAALIFPVAS